VRVDEVKNLRRARAVATTVVVTVLMAAFAFIGSHAALGSRTPKFVLTAGTDFTITSTIYTTPSGVYPAGSCSGTPAVLYPGKVRCIVYHVLNPLSVPITIQSITPALDSAYTAPPAICSGSNLIVPILGTMTVSGNSTVDSPGMPIALKDSGSNQDACKNFTYHFLYTGTAHYTDATITFLASSLNPSTFGHVVTFTATVTAANASSDPSLPSGTVTFGKCPTVSPCGSPAVLGTGTIGTRGQATFTTPSLPVGINYVEAIYPSTTNFLGSTSNVLTEIVNYTAACANTSVINGGLTVVSGQFIAVTCKVNGGVSVQPGGSLILIGASVTGGITSTGAGAIQICRSTIAGASVTRTTGFVAIGDGGDDGSPGCAGNTISGGLTLTNNKGGFEIGGNTLSGTLTLTGNTGTGPTTENAAPEVEGNRITGSLSCATSNVPTITNGGQKNTVTGTKSGQCSGAGF
jgi:hypothetical protein